ncbi:hypothetical protein HanPSC8_Chr16g0723401 [Helianthus annuus]|nr:hypothetical protein HanPSC8_Chr16g0723401 [Helianthus annuus]
MKKKKKKPLSHSSITSNTLRAIHKLKHFETFSTKNSNGYSRTHLSTKINRFHINRYGIA